MKTFLKLFILSIVLANISIAQVEDTIEVGTGWNMIGSLSNGIALGLLRTEPSDIIISSFYGYNPGGGYEAEDTLKKGVGYWVKVSEDGLIIFISDSSMGIPCPGTPTVDYEGKIYNTVKIASKCWLKENLDLGTMIQESDTAKDNGIIEKYCYNDSVENCDIYGGLYEWNEAMQYTATPGTRGICPPGWHIPTLAEFQALSNAVGGDGNALKAIGQGTSEGVGTNTSGFSALLAGRRSSAGYFLGLGSNSYHWSSTAYDILSAQFMGLFYNVNTITFSNISKGMDFSVRCMRD
jgi:uncharacterized protein (TIGR02145 family)